MTDNRIERLSATLNCLWTDPADHDRIASALLALDVKYDLAHKMEREPGVQNILEQMAGRIASAFGSLANVQGQRILDIASGSNTSRAPAHIFVNSPFGETRIENLNSSGFTAQFEPWFCRMLLELGAHPVRIDFGDLEGETFEHHRVDVGQEGALDFLPDHSFDAVQDSRLFGSPEFTAQFPQRADRLRIAREIRRQEQRVLKPEGIVVHSDAKELVGR